MSRGFFVNCSGLSPLMDQLTLCPSSPVVCTPPWECSTPTDRVPLDKKGAAVTLKLDSNSTTFAAHSNTTTSTTSCNPTTSGNSRTSCNPKTSGNGQSSTSSVIPAWTASTNGEGDTFLELVEQFELIAEMCGWNDRAKLVNLNTRLCGQAYSFYRTCTPKERSEYSKLKAKLVARFMPVRIQAVHSNLFHQRKQETGETVDQYAQDLRRLFYKVYSKAKLGSEEAEDLG